MALNARTQYDEHERVPANVGDPEKILYQARVSENGTLDLVETGREDLYGFIQSHKDSVDIHVILKRYMDGDVSVMSRAQGVFADITDAPKSYADLLNAVIAGEQYFASLPVETRAKFDHSFHKWMTMMDKPEFAELMGLTKPNFSLNNNTQPESSNPPNSADQGGRAKE